VLLFVLAFGCVTVMSQSTTDEHGDEPLTSLQTHIEQIDLKILHLKQKNKKMLLQINGLQQQLNSKCNELNETRSVGKCYMLYNQAFKRSSAVWRKHANRSILQTYSMLLNKSSGIITTSLW